MNNQLTVRVAAIGKPELLSGLLDVSVPVGLKNGDVLYYSSNTQNYQVTTLPFVDGANTLIQIKKTANTTTLNLGELYYSFTDRKLYIGNSTGHLVNVAGEYYVDLANSIFYVSNAAYNQANTARTHANAAFALANTKFSSNGGIITGDVGITGNLTVSGQATSAIQTLTDDTTINWNCNSGSKAKVTITDNRTMSAVTNAVEGTTYTLWIIQDSVGSRLINWTTSGDGSFDFGADTAPTLSYTPNTADILAFEAITIAGTLKLRFLGIKRGFT